jgi:hypothetical protein
MDSTQLRTWQAQKIDQRLRPTLGYLFKLRERMQKQGAFRRRISSIS